MNDLSKADVFSAMYNAIIDIPQLDISQSSELTILEHDITEKLEEHSKTCLFEFEYVITKKAFFYGFGYAIVPDANTGNCINSISSIVDSLKFIQLIDDINLLDKYLHKLYEEWYQHGVNIGNKLLEQLRGESL
ncbi:MAG: hypothetical protein ACI4UK_11390 [Floccifex sp.]